MSLEELFISVVKGVVVAMRSSPPEAHEVPLGGSPLTESQLLIGGSLPALAAIAAATALLPLDGYLRLETEAPETDRRRENHRFRQPQGHCAPDLKATQASREVR